MTQTTPSHGQAVEAAGKLSDFDRWFGLQSKMHLATPETIAHNAWYASRSALTSQQEVAAPAEFGPDEDGIVWPVPAMTTPSPNMAEYFSAPQVRAMIAASRVPVASLASREQGVEAVRAKPVIGIFHERANPPQEDWIEWPDGYEPVDGMKIYTAPPSSKTQDDLAVARSISVHVSEAAQAVIDAAREWSGERSIRDWGDAELMKAVCTLDGDWPGCDECDHECDEPCMPATVAQMHRSIDNQIAQLIHEGKLLAYEGYTPPEGFQPYPPRRKTIPIALASQPKAPAPVPVVQGEAVIRFNGDRASASAIATWANAFPEIDEGEPNCSYITTDGVDAVDDLLLAMGDENRPVRVGDYVTRLDSEFIILRFCPMGVDEADELLTALNLDPNTYRTDGGWLNLPKIKAAIANPSEYPRIIPPGGAVGGVGAMDFRQKVASIERSFDHVDGTTFQTPWVKVEFLPNDWMSRDFFADWLATPAPEQATTGSGQADRLKSAFDEGYGLGHRDGMEDCRPMGGSGYGLESCWEDSETRAAILSTASPAGEGEVKT